MFRQGLSKMFFIIILFLVTASFGGDREEELLRSLQEKFEKINTFTVDVVQKSGSKEILSGNLSYKKENKFYFEMKNNIVISDGSAIWNYNKRENKVIINSIDESEPSYFSLNRIIYEYPSECIISTEKEGSSDILIFIPKEDSDLSFSKAKLWINEENLVNKIVLEGVAAENVEVNFSNYILNQNLADSKFTFIPPEGSTVIDLR